MFLGLIVLYPELVFCVVAVALSCLGHAVFLGFFFCCLADAVGSFCAVLGCVAFLIAHDGCLGLFVSGYVLVYVVGYDAVGLWLLCLVVLTVPQCIRIRVFVRCSCECIDPSFYGDLTKYCVRLSLNLYFLLIFYHWSVAIAWGLLFFGFLAVLAQAWWLGPGWAQELAPAAVFSISTGMIGSCPGEGCFA